MKLLLIALTTLITAASAFSTRTATSRDTVSFRRLDSSSRRFASRRDFLTIASTSGVPLLLLLTPPEARAINEIDYQKMQDLLGTSSSSTKENTYTPGGPRPTYLTEPTQDFKQNEQKATEFKRLQIQKKRQFQDLLAKIETDPNDEQLLLQDLDEMRRLVKKYGGLPEGITKEMVVKKVRARKRKKYWPTQVEIAYQDLINEILYQQSPNTERENEGFL